MTQPITRIEFFTPQNIYEDLDAIPRDIHEKIKSLRTQKMDETETLTPTKASLSGLASLLLKIGRLSSNLEAKQTLEGIQPFSKKKTFSEMFSHSLSQRWGHTAYALRAQHEKTQRSIEDFTQKTQGPEASLKTGVIKSKKGQSRLSKLFSGLTTLFSIKALSSSKKSSAFVGIDRSVDKPEDLVLFFIMGMMFNQDMKNTQSFNEQESMLFNYLMYLQGVRVIQNEAKNTTRVLPLNETKSEEKSIQVISPSLSLDPYDDPPIPPELTSFHQQISSIERVLSKVMMRIEVILVNMEGLRVCSQQLVSLFSQVIADISDPTKLLEKATNPLDQALHGLEEDVLDHQGYCVELMDVIDYALEGLFQSNETLETMIQQHALSPTPTVSNQIEKALTSLKTHNLGLTSSLLEIKHELSQLSETADENSRLMDTLI